MFRAPILCKLPLFSCAQWRAYLCAGREEIRSCAVWRIPRYLEVREEMHPHTFRKLEKF